jgi:methenyltetrahydromethanopterin cyclohydrolase
MLLNSLTSSLCHPVPEELDRLKIRLHELANGSRILDFGVETDGSLAAGILLSRICMANLADIQLVPASHAQMPFPMVSVRTDHPLQACMGGQYAGWPVQHEKFFAMGSGPMRTLRGREPVLETYNLIGPDSVAIGVLEVDEIPDDAICQHIADTCSVPVDRLSLCVAPTRSIAGATQVVARSVETCLHKLFELNFDLTQIVSATGSAPLPPPALSFAAGIGRTNDSILYGGHVHLWVRSTDEQIEALGPSVPSRSSKDWGKPFADVFAAYDNDFYKLDPGLFSPAVVTVNNLASGNSWQFGTLRPDLIQSSFETHFESVRA